MDLRLDDPLVSRRHFSVEPVPEGLRLVDAGSTNGTTVNGVRVLEAFLVGGEEIAVGSTVIKLLRLEDEESFALPAEGRFGRVLGESEPMRRLFPLCHRLAQSSIAFVIEGEAGTGKELLAESMHEASPRSDGPFVVVDALSLPGADIETALFGAESAGGHVRAGLVEQADGGTLFLDEIAALPLDLQRKLVRVLERGELLRSFGTSWVHLDVRFIASTKRTLEEEAHQGRFSEELLLAIGAARLTLPPLRRRGGDAGVLARHFWARAGQEGPLPPVLVSSLEGYDWPGNVRELERQVARHVFAGELAPLISSAPSAPPQEGTDFGDLLGEDLSFSALRRKLLERFEGAYVRRMLEVHQGNVSRAAAASGLARRYFHTLKSRSEIR